MKGKHEYCVVALAAKPIIDILVQINDLNNIDIINKPLRTCLKNLEGHL